MGISDPGTGTISLTGAFLIPPRFQLGLILNFAETTGIIAINTVTLFWDGSNWLLISTDAGTNSGS